MTDMTDQPRGLLLVMMDVAPEDEAELNRWYDEQHLPERAGCPGFLTARRFMAVDGTPKYLALYDLESVQVLDSPAYRQLLEFPSPWTKEIGSLLTGNKRQVFVEITEDH